ncbi:MAG: MFS transporter [Clostridium sp.]|uniref:MFS transporter n=2 Tax=Clostridium sp. TaxID=1506 RepID=UPI0030316585
MNSMIFKNRNFLLFLFGQSTSSLGTNILHFATALYVFQITGSAGKFASIIALGMIPNLILGPIAGTITDRVNRKNLIIFGDLIRGVFEISLFIFSLSLNLNIEIMYIMVIFLSACEVFFDPAFTTILPSIVTKNELPEAIAVKRTIGRITSIFAPLLGALLLNLVGFKVMLLLDGLTFLISSFSEIFIEIPLTKPLNKTSCFFKDIAEGFKVLFINKGIISLVSNNIITNVVIIPFIFVGFPYIIVEILGGTQLIYGTVQSAAAFGSILSIFAVFMAKKRYDIDKCIKIVLTISLSSCIFLIPLASKIFISLLNNHFIIITIFFSMIIFIFRFGNAFWDVFYGTFYQTSIPSNLLGRYVAIESLFITISRLIGLKLFGYLFDSYTLLIPMSFLIIGIILKVIIHIPFISKVE